MLCIGCTSEKVSQPTILPQHDKLNPIIDTNNVKIENWSFHLSGGGWNKQLNPNDEVKAYYSNDNRECFVLFVKRNTALSLIEYVEEVSNILRTFGAEHPVIEDIKINELQALLITAEMEQRIFYTWVVVKNGFGYSFSCGGARSERFKNKEFKELLGDGYYK